MKNIILRADRLTKKFGSNRGVDEISFEVEAGTTVGFLGPNGAGKSTTMNMLAGLTTPTSGTCSIFGETVTIQQYKLRNSIGFLASDMSLDGNLTGTQQLQYFCYLRHTESMHRAREFATTLDAQLDKPIKTLSRGNRQKIALIAALMHSPSLLLLDEPTSGLDPLIQAKFNEIIAAHKKAGGTTFISSHVLSEVEELCDTLIFIRNGKIITQTSQAYLRDAAPQRISISSDSEKLPKQLSDMTGVQSLQTIGTTIECTYKGNINELLATLASHNLQRLSITDTDLEDVFLEFYSNSEEQ